MQVRLTFKPTLRREVDGEEEFYPIELTPRMKEIFHRAIYGDDDTVATITSYRVMDKGIVMMIDYHQPLAKIGEWLDNIALYHGSAEDGWMEADLNLEEFPDAEFVPILIDVKIDLSFQEKEE